MGKLKQELFTFGKAQLSALAATLADFLTTIVLAEAAGLWYVAATFIGALTGGVLNFLTNYRWVFKPQRQQKGQMAMRYALVWCGSIGLNTLLTYLLTELSHRYFVLAKVVAAILVGVLWNYLLQRYWVFRNR